MVGQNADDGDQIDFGMEWRSKRCFYCVTPYPRLRLHLHTSGTTGNPKGAFMHRTMFGHLTSMQMFYDFIPKEDRMWTPADWAWVAGLMNCLMCSWHHGVTNVAYRARKYDPEEALRLIAEQYTQHFHTANSSKYYVKSKYSKYETNFAQLQ